MTGPRPEVEASTLAAELNGRYRIESPLGEGGMGRVYAAIDRQLDRRVAIKLIRDELTDPTTRERFMREARAAAALTHPHACRLYEVGDHEGKPFLVMELLEGESLSTRLVRGCLTIEEATAVIVPLMSAIAALHEAGLIHRDLKPANVFLTPSGVKLLDFGLARHTQVDAAATAPAISIAGAVTGTLRYMAPEQVTGDPVDERTDIFALGVLLYEMLTGRIPFKATTNLDWVQAVLKEQPEPLGRDDLRLLEPLVERALQRRPDDRFPSVGEMSTALQRVMSGEASLPHHETGAGPVEHSADSPDALVILPFWPLQEDAEVGFLQNSLPEALTAALSEAGSLHVLSNRAAMHFDANAELATVGRELGVQRLVTGTFLRAGDQVRVTTQLVAASDGHVEWSHTSQHAFANVLTLQDDICAAILPPLQQAVIAGRVDAPDAVPQA